jgi:hypothetical protein
VSDLEQGWFRGERPPVSAPVGAPAAGTTPAGQWPGQPPGRPASRPGRWPPRPRTVIKVAAAVLALLLAGSAGLYFYLGSKLTRVPALAATSAASIASLLPS